MFWLVPGADMTGVQGDDGTSASTPFWPTSAQLNAVFHDQKLPQLGYMNDLLYIASAIAPTPSTTSPWARTPRRSRSAARS